MGSVRKRGKGWQIDYIDPHGKRVRKSFKTKKEASAELGKRVSLIAEGRYLDVKREFKTTLGELAEKYKENHRPQASYKSQKRFALERILKHFGKETLLINVTYLHLESFRHYLINLPTRYGGSRRDASVNREMATLRHLFRKAKEWDMIEQNPFDKGRSLQLKENNKRLRYLGQNSGEVERLLAECPPYLRHIVVCAINTGMRKSELLTLKWEQVRNGYIYLTKTKTNESRQIPVNDALKALFKEIRKEQGLTSEHVFTYNGQTINSKTGKLSKPQQDRKPESVSDIKHAFSAALTRAGIEDFHFHDLRHTFASHLVMKGASLKVVQELLGHKTLTMTLRYAHLSPEHRLKAVNLLNGLAAPENFAAMSQNVTKADFPPKKRVSQVG